MTSAVSGLIEALRREAQAAAFRRDREALRNLADGCDDLAHRCRVILALPDDRGAHCSACGSAVATDGTWRVVDGRWQHSHGGVAFEASGGNE